MSVLLSNTRRWTIIGLLFAAGVINYLDRAVLSVALPLLSKDLHLDPTAKGVLLSAFFWSYALMQLPMGWCADRYNLRWFYAGAFSLWSLACGLTGFATSLGMMLVLRAVLGIGESIYMPGGVKAVSLLIEEKHRGLASGWMNCGTRLGLAVGAPLIAFLAVHYGWRATFVIVGIGSLLWLAPWLAVFPSTGSAPKASAPGKTVPFDWRNRRLLGLCLGHLGYSYYWTLLVTWLPDYLVEARHIPIQKAGTYVMIPFLVFTVSEPLGGWLADRLVRFGWKETTTRKVIITCAFFTSLAILFAGRMANDLAATILIGVASLVGLATGNILALLQRIAPPSQIGMWTGLLNCGGNLSGALAPLITGILIHKTGSFFPGFALAVAVLIAGLPAYWLLVREGERREGSKLSATAIPEQR